MAIGQWFERRFGLDVRRERIVKGDLRWQIVKLLCNLWLWTLDQINTVLYTVQTHELM